MYSWYDYVSSAEHLCNLVWATLIASDMRFFMKLMSFFSIQEEYTLNMKAYSEQMFRNATITELERIQRENYFICTNTSLTFLHLTG